MYDVEGKKVLITGASTGIGQCLADEFARAGAELFASALPHEEQALMELADSWKGRRGQPAHCMGVDLSKPAGARKLYAAAIKAMGRVDVLVNNAGVLAYGDFAEMDPAAMELMITVNLAVYVRMMRLALPDMIQRKQGRILNVGSASAFQPTPFHAVYGATKAAVVAVSAAVGEEVRHHGIKVCTLNPSYVKTAMTTHKGGMPEKLRWYKVSGFPTPDVIAGKGFQAFLEGKEVYVPGVQNFLVHRLLTGFLPLRAKGLLGRIMLK